MVRTIDNSEYEVIKNKIKNYFIKKRISRDNINIVLKKEEFTLAVIISCFDPIYIEYIGLKPIYNNIANDFSIRKV